MRRSVLTAFMMLAACGRAPSSPSSPGPAPVPLAADFAGLWTGEFRLTTCSGERHCVLFIGTTRTFNLRLRQSGFQVNGLFSQGGYTADVAGEILKDGSVVLSGSAPAASSKDGSIRVTGLALRLSPAQGLEGTIAYETQPSPEYSYIQGPTSISGSIVSMTRTNLQTFAAGVDGTWVGRFVIRSCAPLGRSSYCYPNGDQELTELRLSLTRSGDAVSGTFTSGSQVVPVSGHIAGTTVVLSGETLAPSSGGASLIRLTEWSARVDEFGRMTGTFHYDYTYPSGAPTLGESAAAELVQVLKLPS